MSKNEYYSLTRINAKKATYNVIIGERSNGKTYAMLTYALRTYVRNKKQFGYLRRWKEDVTGRRAQRLFSGVVANGEVAKITKGEFTGVHYLAGKFFLCVYDDNGKAIYNDADVIGFTFALSDGEHDKSTSFPNITTIIFDEFLTNKLYLNDEFVLFMNSISTIVRRREDVKIYMLGNTVNKFSPYFSEMGLKHVDKMLQGSIDVYRYGTSKLTVAVEYCATMNIGDNNSSNHYFAFNNPKLEMITSGAWEMNIYPHLPVKYRPKDILFTYFIEFADSVFQCEIINVDNNLFTYVHRKTTPIRKPETTIIYSLDFKPEYYYNRSIYKPTNKHQEKILWFFRNGKVFYQDNEVGDMIDNFLKVSRV